MIKQQEKEKWEEPKILATYEKEELEEVIRPHLPIGYNEFWSFICFSKKGGDSMKKEKWGEPKIIATYEKEELEEVIRPHLTIATYGSNSVL